MKQILCITTLVALTACGQWSDADAPSRPNTSHSPSSDLFVESEPRKKWSGVIEYTMEALRFDREDQDYAFGIPSYD